MAKFLSLLSVVPETDFRFISQSTVRFSSLDYTLSKSAVISAINSYLKRIHFYSSMPIPSEETNFSALKKYDLVPYLYTLINLFLTKQNDLPFYYRFLPELNFKLL